MKRISRRSLDPSLFGTGASTVGECLLDTRTPSPEEAAASNEVLDRSLSRLRTRTQHLLASLTPKERAVLDARFGRTGGSG